MVGIGGSIERVTDEDRFKGVRGWLLFPPVVVVLNLVVLLFALVGALSGSGEEEIVMIVLSVIFVPLGTLAVFMVLKERRPLRRIRPISMCSTIPAAT